MVTDERTRRTSVAVLLLCSNAVLRPIRRSVTVRAQAVAVAFAVAVALAVSQRRSRGCSKDIVRARGGSESRAPHGAIRVIQRHPRCARSALLRTTPSLFRSSFRAGQETEGLKAA